MRDLGEARLSRDDDKSLSIEIQDDAITYMAKARGDRLVYIAHDSDVSGDISPFDREDLGPWLTEPIKIAQWDNLVVKKLDRLTRSLLDFQTLLQWCDKHGKSIISIDEGFDLSTDWGRLIANIIIMFAEFERKRIGERRRDTAAKMRSNGQWPGGTAPYGYVAKEGNGEAGLFQDPDAVPVVRRIINDVIDGIPVKVICETLNREKVPTMRGATEWRGSAVRRMLMSRALRGELQYGRRSIFDDDGNPVKITDDPIITEHEWDLLAEALKARARPYGSYPGTYMMLRIVFCGECGSPLYHQHNRNNNYYRCPGKHGIPGYRAERLEEAVEEDLLRTYGHRMIERRKTTGKDYAGDLRLTEQQLEELDTAYEAGRLSIERYSKVSQGLEARRDELQILVRNAQEATWEPTGETVADRWERLRLDANGRHMMLRRLGITWELSRVYRISDHAWRWEFISSWLPVDGAHERLTRAA
jgi:DNA invertase Pin-like site-specific DNA recombinase